VYRLSRVTTLDEKANKPRPVPGGASRTRRVVHALLLFVAFVIVVDAVVGERGLLEMRRARIESQSLEALLAERRADNADLRERARRLRDDPAAIEEVARRELGLIRPGERVFIIRVRQ
jgi:cell division protein FtsB